MRHSGGRHPNVPSLSTLLISDPPIIVIEGDQVAESKHTRPTLSPLLSPVDSNYASSISSSCSSPHLLSVNQSLPPLQGDDPPKRLKRHPSVSSVSSLTSSCSSSSLITKPTLWHVTSPSISPIMSFSPPSLSRQQQHQQQPSTSTSPPPPAAAASAPSIFTVQHSRSPSPVNTEYNQRPPLPPSTQIIVNEEGETILKRRRGRPPNLREPSEEGGWTFLTPTVWDVKSQQPSQVAVTTEPISNQQQPQQEVATSVTNGSVAAFSSSTMSDTLLHMPRKKRGRKPKTQIAGNSCFVWKDISATRRSTKAMKLAQQQKEEKDNLDQGSTTSFTTATRLRRIEQAPAANTN
ncbi:hypothetical protein HMPREF1544_10224 [Mucor circinelloides 1006PhL]|uniref:Uncharacterized protein n=1 Tax=Mucor circinelloides f. circinelloides (strain 1006PhL) TaxID=1220926 RepID=S2IZ32_MUCC1|nr:hypothetical protein HMPREF1544_10224 [Mucor circinelloides 1006PhL]